MTFNRYSIQISIRVLFIVATVFFLFYYLEKDDRVLTSAALAVLILIQTVLLIRFTSRHLRYISEFLDLLSASEYATIFRSGTREKDLSRLRNSFNRIGKSIQNAMIEKQSSDLFLKHTIDKLSTCILAFNENDQVLIMNEAARRELQIGHILSINELEGTYPGFPRWLKLKAPNTQTIYQLNVKNLSETYLFGISEVIVLQELVKIVSFQNIGEEMGKSEMDSYKKLIRTLTHEIMNTITPITSLAVANRLILSKENTVKDIAELEDEDLKDLFTNNAVLEERSKGLTEFIERFRKISLLPLPEPQPIRIIDLFKETCQLLKESIEHQSIDLSTSITPEDLTLSADKGMIEQVLINLIKNSIEALEGAGQKQISLEAFLKHQRLIIHVVDNGPGIEDSCLHDIFIPFFSTKEKGSGIGLSYSMEVMHLHGGTIRMVPGDENQTVFELSFPE